VPRGERITNSRAAEPADEQRAVDANPLPADVLLTHWRPLQVADPDALRRDLDEIQDAEV
jgi:hypothetical protein